MTLKVCGPHDFKLLQPKTLILYCMLFGIAIVLSWTTEVSASLDIDFQIQWE